MTDIHYCGGGQGGTQSCALVDFKPDQLPSIFKMLIISLLLCLSLSSFALAERAAGTGAPSTGQKKYHTARTMRGAGMERNVELVRAKPTRHSPNFAYFTFVRANHYERIRYTPHTLTPVRREAASWYLSFADFFFLSKDLQNR
jgi:hypothetical protein